ncbi:MAG TPA: Holliday junction branch migration protein RuvA [Candidatus Binataceae bacterium]|nr:Holliday junction branch migration protein RuvA [Candidatus Binataceae bacterium]
MIATLRGILQARDSGRLVVESGGVGYEVFIPLSTYYQLPPIGADVLLEIRQVVREDALNLYGFVTSGEKRAFDLLMQVQHVGPKLALAILSTLTPVELVAAIGREDVERIDAVPGVGPKVAERIVRELRDKAAELKLLAPEPGSTTSASAAGGDGASALDDAVSALVNLGYKPAEAKRAVDAVSANGIAEGAELEAVIRKSLAVLLSER